MKPATADTVSPECTPLLAFFLRWLPGTLLERLVARPWLLFILRVATLLAAFMLVDYFMRRAGMIGRAAYEAPLLIAGIFQRLGAWLTAGIALLLALLARYGALLSAWHAFDKGRELRWFVVFLAAMMAWSFGTYEYNFYFDQGHYVDRAAIVLLVPLLWYRPVFILPFLLLAFAILWQIGEPPIAPSSVFPHKLQVLRVLNLFAAVFLLHAVAGTRQTKDFLMFTCCLVAASYWLSAVAKMQFDWLTYGHTYHIPIAAWSHGWLAFLPPETIVRWAKAISWLDIPMMLYVLAFQAGLLFILWRRPVAIGLLAASVLFHLATFALYGYLFWTWALLNSALAVFLWRDRAENRLDVYRPRYLVTSILLIATSSYWSNPSLLGWLDTGLTYTYRIDGVGDSGERYTLPAAFFAPYDSVMTMGNFRYLNHDIAPLVGPYGVTHDRVRADALMPLRTGEEVLALERETGRVAYDPKLATETYEFIARYVRNRTAAPQRGALFRAIGPPPQFWSFVRGNVYSGQEPLRELALTRVTTLFDGEQIEVIREHELARFDVQQD